MSSTIQKLKTKIYGQVDQVNDETVLQLVQKAVSAYSSSSQKDILDELTFQQSGAYRNQYNKPTKAKCYQMVK